MAIEDFRGAVDLFVEAFNLLPEPREQWNAAGWLLVALGENAIRAGSFQTAEGPLTDAMWCPGTIGNPWVHLRCGQMRFELGQQDRAADELARAYMGGGRDIFEGQDPNTSPSWSKCFSPRRGWIVCLDGPWETANNQLQQTAAAILVSRVSTAQRGRRC